MYGMNVAEEWNSRVLGHREGPGLGFYKEMDRGLVRKQVLLSRHVACKGHTDLHVDLSWSGMI